MSAYSVRNQVGKEVMKINDDEEILFVFLFALFFKLSLNIEPSMISM